MAYLDIYWKEYLKAIYQYGEDHTKDDTKIRQYYGYHQTIPAPPLLNSLQNIHYDKQKIFLQQVKNGEYNLQGYPIKDEALYQYVTAWDKDEMIQCKEFIYTYPERIFNYPQNQYEIIKNRLQHNIGSNRGVAVLYNPEIDKERKDIPCLNWLQATVDENNNLRLHCMFRSNDIYGAWPSNMLLLSYLGFQLVDDLNNLGDFIRDIRFHSIDYHCSCAHYYKTDEEAVKNIIGVK